MAPFLYCFCQQCIAQSHYSKTSKKLKLSDIQQNHWQHSSKESRLEKHKKTEGLSQIGGTKRIWQTTRCNVRSWFRSWEAEKAISGITCNVLIRPLVNNIVTMLISWFQSLYHSVTYHNMLTLGEVAERIRRFYVLLLQHFRNDKRISRPLFFLRNVIIMKSYLEFE